MGRRWVELSWEGMAGVVAERQVREAERGEGAETVARGEERGPVWGRAATGVATVDGGRRRVWRTG